MMLEEAETLVGTLIACVNEAHAAVSHEWRDACWKAAAAAEEKVVLALTGAQPEPSNEYVGWLRAIDEALIVTHLGVANAEDTYEQAREKLNNLIGWHIDVATDPAVNGGWKLAPMVSTYEMDIAGSDHCDGYMSTAQAVWDAMLAEAPNERSEYPEAEQ